MNYQRLYDAIVAKFYGPTRSEAKTIHGYVETHHILPRCQGGTDDESNLVHLPAKAHFLLHYLLVKIHPNSSPLWYAVYMMRNTFKEGTQRGKEYRVSSRTYDIIKRNLSRLGRSDELKRKVSESLMGRKRGPHSEEHKANMSASMKGKKHAYSEEGLVARRKSNKERVRKPRTEESKLKSSIAIREALAKKKELGIGPTEKQIAAKLRPRKKKGPQSEETRQKKRDAWTKRKENGVGNGLSGQKRGPYKKKIKPTY